MYMSHTRRGGEWRYRIDGNDADVDLREGWTCCFVALEAWRGGAGKTLYPENVFNAAGVSLPVKRRKDVLRHVFPDGTRVRDSGIVYEIYVIPPSQPLSDNLPDAYCVYVGKGKKGNRIAEYIRNGSHIAPLIALVLLAGWNVCFRVKQTALPEHDEANLLRRYKYAWNRSGNDGVLALKTRNARGEIEASWMERMFRFASAERRAALRFIGSTLDLPNLHLIANMSEAERELHFRPAPFVVSIARAVQPAVQRAAPRPRANEAVRICEAIKRDGKRCTYKAKGARFCGVHKAQETE